VAIEGRVMAGGGWQLGWNEADRVEVGVGIRIRDQLIHFFFSF
jgi:hypothetical protein